MNLGVGPMRDVPSGLAPASMERMPPSVADHLADPRHAGDLAGADGVGEASDGEGRVVRVGLWRAGPGAVRRARFRATTCPALIAYAEAACQLAEEAALGGPAGLADRIRAAVGGVHPRHLGRADLVARALLRAQAPPGGPA